MYGTNLGQQSRRKRLEIKWNHSDTHTIDKLTHSRTCASDVMTAADFEDCLPEVIHKGGKAEVGDLEAN